jgi:excisionase family DNA binding protein
MADRLLTAPEVAELIGMTTDFVYALARRDEIPHLKFGRTLRFRAEAIEEWLQASERGTLDRSK